VQAFCHRAGEDRTFRADSFKSVRELGLQSRHEPRLDEDPESFVPSAESDVVILRVGEEALWVADSIPIVARRDESDGGATIGLMVSGAAWFERILLQGGPAIQVLSPRKWIETGHRAAERVLDRYR
jgi:proteasome accessory factor C